MTAHDLAERLIAAGIPVVVVRPGDVPPVGWQTLTAEECDLSGYRPGKDALALVGGHGIDAVDVDTKNGGSVDHLPPFKSYGMTRTPSGGEHYIVPSSGLGKISPLRTVDGPVGDYVGGRPDGTGRLLLFLPGSHRSKYPDGGYVEEVPWRVEECLAAQSDPDLLEGLEKAGGSRSQRPDRYVDDSPDRDPALGPHPYAAAVVRDELARLVQCEVDGWSGEGWDNTTFAVACNLVEIGNSGWTGYDLDALHEMFLDTAPADAEFDAHHHEAKWSSALAAVEDGGRRCPDSSPQDDFDPVPADAPKSDGVGGTFARLNLAELMDPDRPPREYVVEPMVAVGTSLALVAPAGHRKSLLLLGLALAVARGDAQFAGMEIPRPRKVFYLDMENTEDDLRERLESFGVTPSDDLSRFILVSLPAMEPLDTAKGGKELLAALDAYGMEPGDLVVLDSYQRVTEAGENDSDTTRGYYRHTGVHLKARGFTVIRTDNTGKDASKGARGSSGKRDDVDVEYLLKSEGEYIEVKTGKVRQRGVSEMSIFVHTDEEGQTTFRNTSATRTTKEQQTKVEACIAALNDMAVDPHLGHNKVEALLRDDDGKLVFPREVIRKAVARRKEPENDFSEILD